MSAGAEDISPQELHERVVYSLMRGGVRLSRRFGFPLREALSLLQMAYFHELRASGMSLDEIGDALDVSRRTAARLSKQLKTNFFRPEREHELPRRIEFMLWAGPMSEARLRRELPDDADEVAGALAQLVAEGRARLEPGRVPRYAVARTAGRLVSAGWTARIGALNSLIGNVTQVVYARFLEGSPRAFARTLSLRVRREDEEALRRLYEDTIWPALEALDEAATGDPDALKMKVSLCWAEYEEPAPEGARHQGEEP